MKDAFGHGSNSLGGSLGVSHQYGVESALGQPQPYGQVASTTPTIQGVKLPNGKVDMSQSVTEPVGPLKVGPGGVITTNTDY